MRRRIYAMLLSVCMLMCLASCDGTATEVNIDNNINNNVDSNIDSNIENDMNNENQQGDSDVDVEINESHNHADSSTKAPTVTEPTKKQETTTKKPTQPAATSPSHTHNYSNATCSQPRTCSCGATIGSALGHQFSNATCTAPKKCSRCGTTSGSALGHNYVSGKCSRCGKVDPESLPVGLHEIPLIDSSYYNSYFHYAYNDKDFTDSFGNKYDGVHFYNGLWERKYSIHNLNNKYSTFTGNIVATQNTLSGSKYCVEIYVDDVLEFSKKDFTKTTGSVPFSVNVKNGYQLKIVVYDAGGSSDVTGMEIGIVNAKLKR